MNFIKKLDITEMLHRYNGKKVNKEKTGMNYLEERNQKIINAIIQRANAVCPDSLAAAHIIIKNISKYVPASFT